MIGMKRCLSESSFCATSGRESSRKVWPVGAVSNTVTSNSVAWTYLRSGAVMMQYGRWA